MSDDRRTDRFDDGDTVTAATPAGGVAVRPSDSGGRYVLGAEIARGGMGRVIVATDSRLGREVAIKEALPRGADLERFEREVRITARLEHPSIVPLYDAGVTTEGRPFYVMRKVSGRPLERMISDRGGSLDDRLALLPHVLATAHALGHAHRRGVIHRDVKPANILVGELGETVVIDWGLAKVIGERSEATGGGDPAGFAGGAGGRAPRGIAEDEVLAAPLVDDAIAPSGEVATQTGAVFGTPGYMAPEQARGSASDPRSDVYALGATLYQVLAGKPPPHGNLAEEVARTERDRGIDAALAALPLPPELVAIVGKAMQFDPAHRYADGAALADDLNRFLAGRLVAAHHYTPAQRLRRFVRRHRGMVAVVASSAIVVVIGGVIAIRGIVLERARAQQAEHDAVADRDRAERARIRADDRADDAVILRARAELERDPTKAIATLATLKPESRRWPQARPIAIEARLRGIAQVYRSDAAVRTFELAPDPRSLLVAGSSTGRVSIIDLEHGRERELLTCQGRCVAAWGERGAVVWIAPVDGGLYAVDVATGARRPAVLDDQIDWLRADPAATYVAFARHRGGGGIFDGAGARRLADFPDEIDHIRVAPDGAWVAFASRQRLVVVDRHGGELARVTGELLPATLTHAASGKQLAILADRTAIEIDVIGGRATTRRVPIAWPVFQLVYIKDALYVNLQSSRELRPLHDLDNRGAEVAVLSWSQPTWNGYTAIGTEPLRLIGPLRPRELWPPVHDPMLTLAARGDSRYLAVHTNGAVVTWDLTDVVPEVLATGLVRAQIFDDQTAIVGGFETYEWLDFATRVRTPIAVPRGFLKWQRGDPATGRQVFVFGREGKLDAAVVARRGRPEAVPIDEPGLRGIDFTGPDLVVGNAGGELVLLRAGAPRRVLHRFDAAVEFVVGNAGWVAAQSLSGMIVRVDPTGAAVTARLPFHVSYLLLTRTGDVYLVTEAHLYRWRGRDFERIATLPSQLASIDHVPERDGIVATTVERAVYAIEPARPEAERVTRLFFRSAVTPRIDDAGRYLVVDTGVRDATVLDLARGTRWRMPWRDPVSSISPTGRRALLFLAGSVAVANLEAPEDPAELHAWVVHATNFTLDSE